MFDGVLAVDAGDGYDEQFERRLRDAMEVVDEGRGVVVLVDLFGSSPCACCVRQVKNRAARIVSGLNLAMLLKLSCLDRHGLDAKAIADACADAGRRAILERECFST